MDELKHSIFRSQALQKHVQRQEQVVLPKLVSPRSFQYLWSFICLFIGLSLAVWLIRVPVYVSGTAIIASNHAQNTGDEIDLVAFFSHASLPHLQTSQYLLVRDSASSRRLRLPLIIVEEGIGHPDDVPEQFELDENISLKVQWPAAIVVAKVEDTSLQLDKAAHPSSVFEVEIEIGSRQILSFFPIFNRVLLD